MIFSYLNKRLISLKGYFLFRVLIFVKSRQTSKLDESENVKKILIFPSVNDDEITLLLSKIDFAFPIKQRFKFYLQCNYQDIDAVKKKIKKDVFQSGHNLEKLHINLIDKKQKININFYDRILCHKINHIPILINSLWKTVVIDKNFYSYQEGVNFQKIYYELLDKRVKDKFAEKSKKNFLRLKKRYKNSNSAYCFLTGPSIGSYRNLSIKENSIKIICNSIVKNKDLLEYIDGPDVITFADPVFHFGATNYSIKFRHCMIEAVRKYDAFVVVPDFTVPLLVGWFPDLENNIIGLETMNDSFNLPSAESLIIRATDNILTMLMLPIALALAEIVYVAGADGREKHEKYFWKFNPDSQFNQDMESVFKAHPSFFRDRQYGQYYDNHCKLVEELINFAEEKNKSVHTLTQSYIPALSKRTKNTVNE